MEIQNTIQSNKEPTNLIQSNEELYFSWWSNQLMELGYIKEIRLQPDSFKLSPGINAEYHEKFLKKEGYKTITEEILGPHVYTPDALIYWEEKALGVFTLMLDSKLRKKKNRSFEYLISQRTDKNELISYVEVKPDFDQNNMTREAKINIKWVFAYYAIFVNLVIPKKHFQKTFTPSRYFFTDKERKPRKINYTPVRTITEFINLKTIQ